MPRSHASRPGVALLLVVMALTASCKRGGPAPTPPEIERIVSPVEVPQVTSSEATTPGRPPIQLTASDGTGLALTSLDARVAIRGPLAFTELTMDFQNPSDRTLEGHFDIVLPDGAAVSRFAMKLPGGWQEAEVVEKQAAREAYEDALHRRQDPALLEQAAGNEFSARVFPIPARGIKSIKLSYSQELPSTDEPYRLPLRGLPLMPALRIVVFVEEQVVRMVKERYPPDADFVLQRPAAASGLQSGALLAMRVRPTLPAAPEEMKGLVILVDTSASRAAGFGKQVAGVGTLVEALRRAHGDGLPLRIAAFDQEVATLYEGTTGGFAAKARPLLDGLLARGALGASDLAGALSWAARTGDATHQRLILVTDGVATASPGLVATKIEEAGDDAPALARAADALKPRFDRLDVVLVGGIRDEAAMRALVTHHLVRDGAVLDGTEAPERLVRRLGEQCHSGLRVSVEGASWVWPQTLEGVQRGDDVMVYAELKSDRRLDMARVSLSGSVEASAEVPLASPDSPGLRPLVERAWARARIASLTAELAAVPRTDAAKLAELDRGILDLSLRHRVLSERTALLVLETEADYARFHIDRHALTDILVVDDGGLHLAHRSDAVLSAPDTTIVDVPTSNEESGADGEGKAGKKDKEKKEEKPADYRRFLAKKARSRPEPADALGNVQGVAMPMPVPAPVAAAPPPPPPPRPPQMRGAEPRMAMSGDTPDALRNRPRAMSPARRPMLREQADYAAAEGDSRGATHGQVTGVAGGMIYAPGALAQPSPPDSGVPALNGKLKEVMDLVTGKQLDAALTAARKWQQEEPGDVLALVALGNVRKARGEISDAARAYGSIIDLFPARADLRRFAGEELESLGAAGEALAADSFAHAARDRADHPNSHRLRAFALLRAGHPAEAFDAIVAGVTRDYPGGRFVGVDQILREDAGLIAAAWIAREPSRRAEIEKRLAPIGVPLPRQPSLRFVLSWETDANDVDFHIADAKGNHAWFAQKHLASGGDLYADVTTGYGPECFTIEGKPGAGPYHIQAHYYSRGPMGYGMGKVEVIRHDGAGKLTFEERPFVVMADHAYVDLGSVDNR